MSIHSYFFNGFKFLCIHLSPELEVGHGDAGAVDVALAAAARHAVQPAHVDAAAAPERGREHHVAVGVGHVGHVAAVVAHVEAVGVAALPHPGVGLAAVLVVGDGEGLGGVDLTTEIFSHFRFIYNISSDYSYCYLEPYMSI